METTELAVEEKQLCCKQLQIHQKNKNDTNTHFLAEKQRRGSQVKRCVGKAIQVTISVLMEIFTNPCPNPHNCNVFVSLNGWFWVLLKTQWCFLQSRLFPPHSGTLQGCITQPVTRTLGKGSPLVVSLQFLRGARIITLWFHLLLTSSKWNPKSRIQ